MRVFRESLCGHTARVATSVVAPPPPGRPHVVLVGFEWRRKTALRLIAPARCVLHHVTRFFGFGFGGMEARVSPLVSRLSFFFFFFWIRGGGWAVCPFPPNVHIRHRYLT